MYLNRPIAIAINVVVTCPFWATAFVKAVDFDGTVAEVAAIGLPSASSWPP